MLIPLDVNSIDDYRKFLRIKSLPKYRIRGGFAEFPDEYAERIGCVDQATYPEIEYDPKPWLFDYQRDIAGLAIARRKFAVFARCGLGKHNIMMEYARHALAALRGRSVMIVEPLMVVEQAMEEVAKFYGDELPVQAVPANRLKEWMRTGTGIGIANYEGIADGLEIGNVGALILDESAMLKSHYGKWGTRLLALGKGLDWKLCLTGMAAPNDRIEYANHAVFLDHFPSVNAFLARFFVNRGQTQNRWELKKHAITGFYRSMAHWGIFLNDPGVYGWKDNSHTLPPIVEHLDRVPLTGEQRGIVHATTGNLFVDQVGGFVSRSRLAQIAKGFDGENKITSNKPAFIKRLVESWPDESTIIWCRYNQEQDAMAALFPNAASMDGDTPHHVRREMIRDFKSGAQKILISKPRVLGFGLNLQKCTRMVFSGLQDSLEEYWQAVCRANRVGSTKPLNVHIPYTDIEAPMIDNVLQKARRVEKDTIEQERIFKEIRDAS